MMDKVLITGGSGYIGGRLVQALVEESRFHLRLGVRQPRAIRPVWPREAEIVPLGLVSPEDLNAACRGVRYIIHLAALNEIESLANPEEALRINGLGSLKLLEAAKRAGVERFIYFSTAHVYGVPLAGMITEESLPRPHHPYAITHRVAEDFVLAAHDQKTIQGIALRLSNGFGAPAAVNVNRWTLIVNDLCRQAVTTGKLVLKSSGLQWRDFITLSDVARSVQHLLNLPASALQDGLFNLGGECSLQIIDLAQRIANRASGFLGFTPPIHRPGPGPTESFQPLEYKVDKLKSTGFTLNRNIDEEIDATLLFCKKVFGKKSEW
ncbi:MAG: SDR family oxidoreductase [Proteobacteria bacterium]|nr:SDR family oxidoreductase [Pseudomonadota bacterium]